MALKSEITLKWADEEYSVTVNMDLIDKIDEELNLMKLTMRMANNDVRFSHAAKLVHILLTEAGCKVTRDELWEKMFGDGTASMMDIVDMVSDILQAIYPQQESKKKPVRRKTKK